MKATFRSFAAIILVLIFARITSAYISNYPPHSFISGPYPRIDIKLLVSWKGPVLNVSKDGKVSTKIENDGKSFKSTIEDDGLLVYYYGEQIYGVPPLIDIYGGDIDRNGLNDFIVIEHSRQMGIPLEGASATILLKVSSTEYRQIFFPSVNPGPEDFVDMNKDGKCEVIISGFYRGESHNYFTYSIYELRDYELINADSKYKDFPKFVWYSNEPNDKDTSKLSDSIRKLIVSETNAAIRTKRVTLQAVKVDPSKEQKEKPKKIEVSALDYWPLIKGDSYIASTGNSYKWHFTSEVKIAGDQYIKHCTNSLFSWDYIQKYSLYKILNFDGIPWICRAGEYSYAERAYELELLENPEKEMPLIIELGREYTLVDIPGLSLLSRKKVYYLEDMVTKDGKTIKGCLIEETKFSNTTIVSCYVKGRGRIEAKTLESKWSFSGDPMPYEDTYQNRNSLRPSYGQSDSRELDLKIKKDLDSLRTYHKYSDIISVLKADPYYASPYDYGVFGSGGVAYWRCNGRDIMITFGKSDFIDKIVVDEGTFYFRDL